MSKHSLFFLSLASVSAVLLGICVTIRNNAYSTVLRHFDEEIRLGDSDYEQIMRRSAKGALFAGSIYSLAILSSFLGVVFGGFEKYYLPIEISSLAFFMLGFIPLVYSLLTGHLKMGSPFKSLRKPEEPDRDERPELEVENDDQ